MPTLCIGSYDAATKASKEEARAGILLTKKTPENVIEKLHKGFFTKDFDPVELQLEDISCLQESELTEEFMNMIEAADTDKDMILSKLAKMIEASYPDLVACMRDVNAIDIDLARTGVIMTNSRRKLASAENLLVTGSLRITQLQNFRCRLETIQLICQRLKDVKDLFHKMMENVQVGNTGTAAECAIRILQLLQSETYEVLDAVQSYSIEVHQVIPLIRQKTDNAFHRLCCRKFASSDLSNILKAYLLLDDMREKMGVQIIDPYINQRKQGAFVYDSHGCLDGLCPRIQRFLSADIAACIRNSLVEFIHAGLVRKQQHQQSISNASSNNHSHNHTNSTMDNNTISVFQVQSELAESSLPTLYPKLSADMVLPCIIRTCEYLADIVHTYYEIFIWLRLPFDEKNDDVMFLHRYAASSKDLKADENVSTWQEEEDIDSEEEEEEEEDGEEEEDLEGGHERTAERDGSGAREDVKGSNNWYSTRMRRLWRAQLSSAYSELKDGRLLLWDQVQKAVIEFLQAVTISGNIPVEDYLAMTWSLQSLAKLGREFCGADSSNLLSCLREKSGEYISELHKEYFKLLRQMVESESWKSVPVRFSELGGILGIVKSNLQKDNRSRLREPVRVRGMLREAYVAQQRYAASLAAKYAAALAPPIKKPPLTLTAAANLMNKENSTKTDESHEDEMTFLMSFATYGNPLHLLRDGEIFEEEMSIQKLENNSKGAENTLNFNSNLSSATASNSSMKGKPLDSVDTCPDVLSLMFEEEISASSSKRSSAMVVTQSALNGLAKYAGKYLQLMHVMTALAPDVFSGLMELFGYYICEVFGTFVPTEDRNRCLSRQIPRATAPAPIQSKDFEVR